jgi:hypothetical protein
MDTTETMWDIDVKYFFRVTDDNYIQLAIKFDGGELEISAQFKLRFENLYENINFILKGHIEAHLPYQGMPVFQKSKLLTKHEFARIIKAIQDEKLAITEQAKSNETPLIEYLRLQNLSPEPSGNNPNSWMANCPCGGQHHIYVVTTEDTWGCGYCKRKGKLPELKIWLAEIKIKKDQNKLSRMMQELNNEGSIESKDLQNWWMNRY